MLSILRTQRAGSAAHQHRDLLALAGFIRIRVETNPAQGRITALSVRL